MDAGAIWELIILNPLINVLIVVAKYLFGSFGLAIIALTIIIRVVTYPLNRRQLMSSKRMQELQPRVAELQKKYARDRQRLAKEQMALYKEAGISPMGCLVPMLVQMPVWIALYQSIIRVLATGPEELLNLSRHLYTSWTLVFDQVPLQSHFLWFDLGTPDRLMLLPILVGATMWLQQKMVTPASPDPSQQAQSQMMLWMMPLMFAFFSLSFPSGLALYWLVSNVISIVMQYFVTGWGGLAGMFGIFGKKPPADKKTARPAVIEGKKLTPKQESPAPPAVKSPQIADKRKQKWMFWK